MRPDRLSLLLRTGMFLSRRLKVDQGAVQVDPGHGVPVVRAEVNVGVDGRPIEAAMRRLRPGQSVQVEPVLLL